MNAIKCSVLGILGMLGVLVSTIGPLKVPFAATLAKTYRRQAIVGLVTLALTTVTLVTAVVKLFDPNQFKGPIVRWVHERTQRDLVLDGELSMRYFPKLGIETGKASLSQRRSAREFASLDNAHVTFAWWPLLRRELQIDSLDVQGLRTQLVRFKDGSTNVDDLAADLAILLPAGIALDSLRLSRGTLRWNDEITWQRGSLNELQLEVGRIADGQAGPLTASARVDAALAGIDAQLQLRGRLLYDAAAGRVELARTESRLEGRAFGVDNLSLNLQGDVTALLRERSLAVTNLVAASLSKSGLNVYNSKLTLPELLLDEHRLSGSALRFEASVEHPDRSATLALQLPRVEWAEGALRDTTAEARLTLRTPTAQLRASASSALRLLWGDDPRIELGSLELGVNAKHAALEKETAASLNGRLDVQLLEQTAHAVWTGQLAGSDWRGEVTLADFGRPRWSFDVEATRLDLDALLSPAWLAQWSDDAAAFDVGALRDTQAQGRLRAGQIVFGGALASAASARVELDKALLVAEPITAQFYEAPLDASLRIEAGAAPRLATKGAVTGLAVRGLLADVKAAPWLDGRGSVDWDLSTTGASLGTLRGALAGTLNIALQSGAVAGIDLRAALQQAKSDPAVHTAAVPREFDAALATPFSELKANVELREGRAVARAVELSHPALRAAGEGELLFDSGALQLRLQAGTSRDAPEGPTLAGAGVPLQVRGPWRSPRFSFDVDGPAGASVSRAVEPGVRPLALVGEAAVVAAGGNAAPAAR